MNPIESATKIIVDEEEIEFSVCDLKRTPHPNMSPINKVLPCGIGVKDGEIYECPTEQYKKCSKNQSRLYS